jgi:AcrR family transcriptional regulator
VALEQPAESSRRAEILQTAETLIASSGLRTSLQEIASAAGILTGSLYHHFASRDDLLLELVRRYHAELTRAGELGLQRLDAHDAATVQDKVIELGADIARCAVRNRAALQMSFYEAPTESPALVELLRHPPKSLQDAMVQTLRAGRWSGYVRSDLDLAVVADRICQSMLHVGLDVIRRDAEPDVVAGTTCRVMLTGLAVGSHTDDELNASNALAAADAVIATWSSEADTAGGGGKAVHVRNAARKVFGRKGFEVATIRDIAAEADLNAATVYRIIGSKDQLLAAIMRDFGEKTVTASVAVMQSRATPVEKLDALSWIFINAVDQFPDEWKIQLAWMRQSPPDSPNPGYAFASRMEQLADLLAAGGRSGDLKIDAGPLDVLSRCVMDVLWVPGNIIGDKGISAALTLARDTVLRGIARSQ